MVYKFVDKTLVTLAGPQSWGCRGWNAVHARDDWSVTAPATGRWDHPIWSGLVFSCLVLSCQVGSGLVELVLVRSCWVGSGLVGLGQVWSCPVRLGQVRSGWVGSGQVGSDLLGLGLVGLGLVLLGLVKLGLAFLGWFWSCWVWSGWVWSGQVGSGLVGFWSCCIWSGWVWPCWVGSGLLGSGWVWSGVGGLGWVWSLCGDGGASIAQSCKDYGERFNKSATFCTFIFWSPPPHLLPSFYFLLKQRSSCTHQSHSLGQFCWRWSCVAQQADTNVDERSPESSIELISLMSSWAAQSGHSHCVGSRAYMCSAVTCQLHFWQDDQLNFFFVLATVVTWGVE